MKALKPLPLLIIALVQTISLRADVLPPLQDTYSSNGRLTAVTGRAGALAVSSSCKSFVLFDLTKLPADVLPEDIAQARLRVYFPLTLKPGHVDIHAVASSGSLWSETGSSAEPAVDGRPIASIPASAVIAKTFQELDVTDTVRAWRRGTKPNCGFAFLAAGATRVTLGSKEGPGSGFPCQLEVQIDRVSVDGSIDGAQLANGSITNAKIAVGAVSNDQLANASFTITAGAGLEGGGKVALGSSVKLSLLPDLQLGGTTVGSFKGDGSALTGLNAANLTGDLTVAPLPDSTLFQIKFESGISRTELGNGNAFGLVVKGGCAFLADYGGGLRVLDVADPRNPLVIASLPLTPANFGARAVATAGDYLYVANGTGGVRIIDVTDPRNPVLKGAAGADASAQAASVAVNGSLCYSSIGNNLVILDVSDPLNPLVKTRFFINGSSTVGRLAVSAGYAYVANSSNGLRIVDVSDPLNPVLRKTFATSEFGSGSTSDVAIAGTYAYVACGGGGLAIIDIASPATPVIRRVLPLSLFALGSATSITISGHLAYVGTGSEGGMTILDISDPLNPKHLGTLPQARMGYAGNGTVSQVAVAAPYLFVANGLDGFSVLSTSTTVTAATGSTLGNSQIVVNGGSIGIGRTPASNKLEVEGDASKLVAGAWLANSDRRIKTDIQPIRGALEKLNRVRLVDFRYTEEYRAAHPGLADTRYLNVIAQEFAEVFPEHVRQSGEKLPDGSPVLQVDTYPLTVFSAAAVQELGERLKDKEAELAQLRNETSELKKRLEQVESRVRQGSRGRR